MTLDEFGVRLEKLSSLDSKSAAIGVNDAEVSDYARSLEYGSVAGEKPWPRPGARTVAAVDPDSGAEVVVSTQAPQGFIRIQAPQFLSRLRREIAAPADWLDADAVDHHLGEAINSVAHAALEQIRSAAPRASGRLSQSLEIARTTPS